MKKVTLITTILILATSYASFAGNPTNSNAMKPTGTIAVVGSENNNAVETTFSQLNDVEIDIENTVSYLEKYQLRKSTSTKSKLNNVQNLLKNPEQKEIATKVLC